MINPGGASFNRKISLATLDIIIENLMGDYVRIQDRRLSVSINEFGERLHRHCTQIMPGFQQYQTLRQELITAECENLRLETYQVKPLASFVRNKLTNEVYCFLSKIIWPNKWVQSAKPKVPTDELAADFAARLWRQ
jgi:hypothetical protein